MSDHPFFSIIIPTYNQAQYLTFALDSLLSQIDTDWEAVVVNDGSTDNTPDVLREYADKDARIKPFHKKNGGTATALNEGLRHATGDWVCWLSSDDMFDPKKLEIHRKWIQKEPDTRFFFTYFRLLRQSTGQIEDHGLWGPLPEKEFQILGLFYRNYISGISICIHRASWESIGQFDEKLRYAQDYDMWLRLLKEFPATFIPEWTCINRNHALQGSEVFPQACYYDTSKAAIRFINAFPFEDLFPLISFDNNSKVNRVVTEVLRIASDSTGFLYMLGPNPALLLRMIDWLNQKQSLFSNQEWNSLQRKISRSFISTIREHNGDLFGFQYKIALTVLKSGMKNCYDPVSPVSVAEGFYRSDLSQNVLSKEPLRRYLETFDSVQLPPLIPSKQFNEVVLVTNGNHAGKTNLDFFERLTATLHQNGVRVIWMILSNSTGSLRPLAVPAITVHNLRRVGAIIPAIGPFDLLVTDQNLPPWIKLWAGRTVHLNSDQIEKFPAAYNFLENNTDIPRLWYSKAFHFIYSNIILPGLPGLVKKGWRSFRTFAGRVRRRLFKQKVR
jgi:glycosyltransferase involved in cell wall biosynthesis